MHRLCIKTHKNYIVRFFLGNKSSDLESNSFEFLYIFVLKKLTYLILLLLVDIENGLSIEAHCHFSSILEFRIKAKWADKVASTRSAAQKLEVVLSTIEKPLLNTALSNYDFFSSQIGV